MKYLLLILILTIACEEPRPTPAVSWTVGSEKGSTVGASTIERNDGLKVWVLFAAAGQSNETQVWRIEWAPAATEDSCFVPFAYPILSEHRSPGLFSVKISGTLPGDKIMVWRSHPWPGGGNTPGITDSLCMMSVR